MTSDNEMTNQAAQTMPELPKSDQWGFEQQSWLYTDDQMHQYARDYAAALSQTAGVVEGWTREDLQDLYGRLVSAGISKFMEGSSSKVRDREFIRRAITEAWGLIGDMLASAPAASGVDTSTNEAWAARAQEKIEAMDAASVSERARYTEQMVRDASGKAWEYMGDADVVPLGLALELVQALTQQRGSASYDAGMAMHWIERYAAGIDEECQLDRIAEAFTTPQPSADAVRDQHGDFQDKALAWDAVCETLDLVHPNWRINGRTGLQAAVLTVQKISGPVGELREMANRWLTSAADTKRHATTDYESGCAAEQKRCADELKSLLSGGSNA